MAASMGPDVRVALQVTTSLRLKTWGYVLQHGIQPRILEVHSVRGVRWRLAEPVDVQAWMSTVHRGNFTHCHSQDSLSKLLMEKGGCDADLGKNGAEDLGLMGCTWALYFASSQVWQLRFAVWSENFARWGSF